MSWSSSAVSNDQFFNDFMDIESSGWKGPDGSGTSVASDPISRAFFHSLMVDSNNELYTRVFQLQFGEEKVASILAIRNNSTWYLLKQGYTDKYKAYGPGSILLQALIELMIKDSEITEISLTTAPAWASRWHFGEIPVYEALLFAPSIRGKISQFCFHVKRLLLPLKASLESRLQGAGT
jgi:hypothetical protein